MVYTGLTLLSVAIISIALGIEISGLRWVLAVAALCLVALLAVVLTVPRSYSAAGSVRVKAGIHQVFDTLAGSTDWRTDVPLIESLSASRWRETWTPYRIVDMERIESQSPTRVVFRAAGTGGGYQSVRTCSLVSSPEGDTLVNVTENGEFREFNDRIYQHIFASPQNNIDRYLAALVEYFSRRSSATSAHGS